MSAKGGGFIPVSAVGDRLKFLRRENGVEVYFDLQTNQEVYAGRPEIQGEVPEAIETRVHRMIDEAWAIERQGKMPKPSWFGKRDPRYTRLQTEMLPELERLKQGPGQNIMMVYYAMGVVLRLLDRRSEAEAEFLSAHELEPENTAVLRDLVRSLGEQDRPQEALPFARKAANIAPTDATLVGNVAACLLECGDLKEAMTVITEALELDPANVLNQRMHEHILKRLR
jgi:tetratricopeptide (TPR) repeat protein